MQKECRSNLLGRDHEHMVLETVEKITVPDTTAAAENNIRQRRDALKALQALRRCEIAFCEFQLSKRRAAAQATDGRDGSAVIEIELRESRDAAKALRR